MDREPSQELTNRNGKLDILLTPQASFFEHVGVTLPISERHPAALSGIGERPLDIFAKSDTPTKSGILITTEMYGRLLQRPDSRKLSDDERRTLKEAGKAANTDFEAYIEQVDQRRIAAGRESVYYSFGRLTGNDLFYTDVATTPDGSKVPHAGFPFRFRKDEQHWENPDEAIIRAYLTVTPDEAANIQRHFVDASLALYDQGIDFKAKAASPRRLVIRTDNTVFYIGEHDQKRVEATLKQFLLEKQIGSGHVLAAVPSSVDGLSWAPDPDIRQQELVREVTGSSKASTYGSYNIFVATMAAPTYFERLAQMHSQKGNSQESDLLRKEAERIGIIIEKHQKAA